MTERFAIQLLNMSFGAGIMTVIVIGLRVLIHRLPKGYSYALWSFVLFRLFCPISIPSPLSLFPAAPPMEEGMIYESIPEISSGITVIDEPVNRMLRDALLVQEVFGSANQLQTAIFIFLILWAIGVAVFLLYHIIQYVKLRGHLATAIRVEADVFETEALDMPIVIGLIAPSIYLPPGLEGTVREAVLAHEQIHIRRKDYLVKGIGFLALALHWFNPLVWAAFILMDRDMEMSCDERALNEMGEGKVKEYSMALLTFSAERSGILLPLAFGEGHTKERIKNILNYKKTSRWIQVAAVLCFAGLAVTFLTNPPTKDKFISLIGGADGPTAIYIAGNPSGNGDAVKAVPFSSEEASRQSLPIKEELRESGCRQISLDYASEDRIVLHGSFGIGIFEQKNGFWQMTHSINMESMDEQYGSDDYESVVFYNKSGLLIGFRTESGYEDTFWIYNEKDEMLVEMEGGNVFLGGMEELYTSQMPERIPAELTEFGPLYAARMLDNGCLGFLSADGTEVSSLWYGVYDSEKKELTRVRLFAD